MTSDDGWGPVHEAWVRELEYIRGYPPEVTHQAGCAPCGTGHGPLTKHEAEMWKRGHDRALERMSARVVYPLRDAAATLLAAADDVWIEGTADETDALIEARNRLRKLLYGAD